ncbi:MAG TPA: 23S rRNA (pseudouridine(1915)-N(3))-methyltransferase RlmH [Candidatus Cloacimonetes bacterium]|nr:23S rRNA (pseudouridine(1915)-N(3))-methyltransferase RlmH [Candidatus Cloacimonadota bacterium]
MNITILALGKNKDEYISLAENEFLKRLSGFCSLAIETIPTPKQRKNQPIEKIKEIEGKTILAALPDQCYIIALDESGKEFTSKNFARHLNKILASYNKPLYFIIGGPYGFSQEVKDRADELLSLSQLTFTHQMVRIILLEQIYRAFTILKGKKYHY